jgi:hypothetical protein
MPSIKPRFEVHKLDGTVSHTIMVKTKSGDEGKFGGFEEKIIEEDAGYMVYFPTGASIRVRTEKELERLGFMRDPELVDMESGDVVGVANTSLKARADQIAGRGRSKAPGNT